MKHITSKIISFISVICMAFAVNTFVLAADAAPEILVKMDSTKKTADISIKNAGTMIYSAQMTLDMSDSQNYTLVCENSSMYGTTKTENGKVVLYIDSTELLNGNQEVKLAKLSSGSEMTIGSAADLILVDYSMRPTTYTGVRVNVSVETANNTGGTGGGGAGGGGGGREIAGGGTYLPSVVQGNNNAAKKTFNDVPDNHWAKNAIDFVTTAGLFEGTSDTTFAPTQNMTRAMYVVVLNRFGTKIDSKWQIPCDNPMKFDDIPDGMWYSDAVAWAGGTGLVTGIGANNFAPDNSITREQMALITVNFAKLCGVEMPSKVQAASFTDEASINSWAADAVHAAQRAGIINGRDDGSFAPQDTATRAEVAAIMQRLVVLLK